MNLEFAKDFHIKGVTVMVRNEGYISKRIKCKRWFTVEIPAHKGSLHPALFSYCATGSLCMLNGLIGLHSGECVTPTNHIPSTVKY